jgi:uncharacterized protein YoxC
MPTAAVIAIIVIGAVNVAVLIALTVAILYLRREMQNVMGEIRPVIPQARLIVDDVKGVTHEVGEVVQRVETMVDRLGSRVEAIADTSERTVKDLSQRVEAVVDQVSGRAEAIADTSERTVKDLSHRVQTTGHIMQETVTSPVIGVAGVIAGISRGLSVLKAYQDGKEDKPNGKQE